MRENEERWEDQPRTSWGLEEMRAEFLERLTGPQPLAPTPRDSEDWEAADQEIETLRKALRAIVARIRGVWDHPDLTAFGPLHYIEGDIHAIAAKALNTPSYH